MTLIILCAVLLGLAFDVTRGPTIALVTIVFLWIAFPVPTTLFLIGAGALYFFTQHY